MATPRIQRDRKKIAGVGGRHALRPAIRLEFSNQPLLKSFCCPLNSGEMDLIIMSHAVRFISNSALETLENGAPVSGVENIGIITLNAKA